MWLLANRYLRQNANEADVEWGYSFDVHMNAFFPPLVLLHFVQLIFFNGKDTTQSLEIVKLIITHSTFYVMTHYLFHSFFLSGVINSESFFPRLFGNTIWLIAIIYYTYITFLGYNCEYPTVAKSIDSFDTQSSISTK